MQKLVLIYTLLFPGGSSTSESTTVATNQTKTEVKVEEKEKLEEGEISSETPLSEILGGKNPIFFCNEVSKFKCLKLDWEQISETGNKKPQSIIMLTKRQFRFTIFSLR